MKDYTKKLFGILIIIILLSANLPLKVHAEGPDISVADFDELQDAIGTVPADGTLKIIEITQDITVTSAIVINAGQNIRLVASIGTSVKLAYNMAATDHVLVIKEDATLTLGQSTADTDIITIDGNGSGSGALVSNEGKFILNQGIITGATGTAEATCGGGVYNSGTFVMNGGTIKDNKASKSGGGVYNSGAFMMSGGVITGNSVKALDSTEENKKGSGGGVYNLGTFTMSGGSVDHNTAEADGGGIFNNGTFTMSGGSSHANQADDGAGVYSNGEFVMQDNATISNNTAASKGGGLFHACLPDKETFTMNGGVIKDNDTNGLGGGIFVQSGSIILMNGIISGNSAGSGGGIYIYGETNVLGAHGTATINDALITNNDATLQGGGVWLCPTGGVKAYANDFSSVVGNKVNDDKDSVGGDDYYIKQHDLGKGIPTIGFPKTALNKAVFKYYNDTSPRRYPSGDEIINPGVINFNAEDTGLHVEFENQVISEQSISALRSIAKIIIENNHAREGGGIASNGVINFGEKDEKVKETTVILKANKELIGKTLTAGAFQFQLKNKAGEIIETVSNTADGSIIFGSLTCTEEGTYTYTISEVQGTEKGMTYDQNEIKVTVVVKEVAGELIATPTYEKSQEKSQTFTNTYTPEVSDKSTSINLKANKILTGKTLISGAYQFQLKDQNGTVIQTKSNQADGSILFDRLNYTSAGTYTYTISEVQGRESGITYDGHVIKVTVKVTEIAGDLTAVATYEGAQTFTNNYTPGSSDKSAPVNLKANKILTGKTLISGAYQFQLKDQNGTVIQTKSNQADGSILFDRLNYTSAGTYTYTISELQGMESGITYDGHSLKVIVTVIETADGKLSAAVTYDGAQTFTNAYTPTPSGRSTAVALKANKILIGKTLKAGAYQFQLKDATGNVLQTKSNQGDGTIDFEHLTYVKAGTYTYTISEIQGTDSHVTYDGHIIKVTVIVVETEGTLSTQLTYDGSQLFTNTYTEKVPTTYQSYMKILPKTGEKTSVLTLLLGALLVLLVGRVVFKNKKANS